MYKHYGTNDAINDAVSSNKYTEIFFLFVVNVLIIPRMDVTKLGTLANFIKFNDD